MKTINNFSGRYDYLSNFYYATFVLNGITWPTVEHYFQAMKTFDINEIEHIRSLATPGKAKREGNRVHLRTDWEDVKRNIMEEAVSAKFEQNQDLMSKLLGTGSVHIVEGNKWHDNTWGHCICNRCTNIPGKNHLGNILMYIRLNNQ